MEQEGSLAGVLRISSRDRIEQVARGLLYMNTLEYFIKLEADMLRGDSGEATSPYLSRRRRSTAHQDRR
jgi:hypothetical protein